MLVLDEDSMNVMDGMQNNEIIYCQFKGKKIGTSSTTTFIMYG